MILCFTQKRTSFLNCVKQSITNINDTVEEAKLYLYSFTTKTYLEYSFPICMTT